MKGSSMNLNYVSTFSGKGQIVILNLEQRRRETLVRIRRNLSTSTVHRFSLYKRENAR